MIIERYAKVKKRMSEHGFTLVELLVGIAIVGILVSIAYPIWTNVQNAQHETAVKQKLSQIAVLIEQESIDNNGYIPKYVPNEILADPIAREFTYEQKDRLDWCVTAKIERTSLIPFAPSTTTLWFVSSGNTSPSNTVICGGPGYIPMEGSAAPWEPPTITSPAITSHSTTWPNTNNYASLAVGYSAGSCTLNSTDNGLFNPDVTMQYRVEIHNTMSGRTNTILTTSLSGGLSNQIASLTGFYPRDTYSVRVQSICTVKTNNGFPYEYFSDWSNFSNGTITPFTVPNPAWSSLTYNVGAGDATVANRFSATWTSPYVCPLGSTKRYTVAVTLPGDATLAAQTIGATTTSLTNANLTHNKPGFRYQFALRAICDYASSGVNVNVQSNAVNRTDRAALRPPTGTLSIESYTAPETSVTLTPSGFVINRGASTQFACAAGTPVVTMRATDASGVVFPARTVAFGAVADYFSQLVANGTINKNINLTGTVACSGVVDGATQTSANSTNTASASFFVRYKIPAVPAVPTGFGNNNLGGASYDNDRLTWAAVTCEHDGTPEYQVRQIQKASNNVFAEAARPAVGGTITATHVNLTNTQLNAGSRVKFEVRARCVNDNGQSAWTAYGTGSGAEWVTTIPTPGAPTVSGSNLTVTITAPANACPAGTTLQLRAYSDRNHNNSTMATPNPITVNTAVAQQTSWTVPHKDYGHYIGVNASVRCVGPDATGAYGAGGWATWSSPVSIWWSYFGVGGAQGTWGQRRTWYQYTCQGGVFNDGYITISSSGDASGTWPIPLGGTSTTGEVYLPNNTWGSGFVELGMRCSNPASGLTTVTFPRLNF